MIEAPTAQDWFLRKHDDGEIFGPLPFAQLARWAFSAQVAPHDSISTDQVTWMKAPMLAELQMDWLVELTSERYYGPTTLGAIQEFMRLGEINEQTLIINSCDGTRRAIADLSLVLQPQVEVVDAAMGETLAAPPASGMAINVQDRIRDLEQSLREERRALLEAEERNRALELKYRELAAKS
ncbi:MAG: hypothetical protein ABJB09_05340 [Verrucomicrobiota bacterium]